MKTFKKLIVILMVLVFALSMNSCKKAKTRNCTTAIVDYATAISKISGGTATCEEVQKELISLYKDCKAYMGSGYSEEDINKLCRP